MTDEQLETLCSTIEHLDHEVELLTAATREQTQALNNALTTVHADTVVTLRRGARLMARAILSSSQSSITAAATREIAHELERDL